MGSSCEGSTRPAERIILPASSRVMELLVTFVSSTRTTKPVMGFGDVGMKTEVVFFPLCGSLKFPVMKPMSWQPGLGYSI